ncbi:hypothetical protein Pryu01_01657 [Paraliobacillus ryukyuensis]|uniref:Spore coat protein CotO n=1 Tax=Paraliobacillus ryukyuensis TaxID=200904 RepID=A0A366E718_9BACI|nr:spore coat protein CotO [Paraliobacillus ryukyuensis]
MGTTQSFLTYSIEENDFEEEYPVSRRKKVAKRRPKLYIDQPNLATPAANMQEDYESPKKSVDNIEKTISDRPTKRSKKRTNQADEENNQKTDVLFAEEDTIDKPNWEETLEENHIEVLEDNDTTAEVTNTINKVPFKEMTLLEQVDYLATSPRFTPKLKCEIITTDNRLKGIITKREDSTVFVETLKRPKFHQVTLDDIKMIRLLSF